MGRVKRKIRCIAVAPDVVKEIAMIVGCGKATVYRALRLETAGEQPERIRALAKEKGGEVTTKVIFEREITA